MLSFVKKKKKKDVSLGAPPEVSQFSVAVGCQWVMGDPPLTRHHHHSFRMMMWKATEQLPHLSRKSLSLSEKPTYLSVPGDSGLEGGRKSPRVRIWVQQEECQSQVRSARESQVHLEAPSLVPCHRCFCSRLVIFIVTYHTQS